MDSLFELSTYSSSVIWFFYQKLSPSGRVWIHFQKHSSIMISSYLGETKYDFYLIKTSLLIILRLRGRRADNLWH